MKRFLFLPALLLTACVSLCALPVTAQTVTMPFSETPDCSFSAQSVLLIDRDTGEVLYEQQADDTIRPASTTKILTALCALEQATDLDDTLITVQDSVLEPLLYSDNTTAGLVDGEQLTLRQLLYAMLLPSGNDAALIIADYFGGGNVSTFAESLNEKAAAIGCTGTHFTNPDGLDEDDHYTTARDMAMIAAAAMENEVFREVVSAASYTLTTNAHDSLLLENTDALLDPASELYYAPVCGIKTGYTDLAGRCFVGAAEQNGLRLLSVVMNAPVFDTNGELYASSQALVQTRALYEWAFKAFTRVALCGSETAFSLPVSLAQEATLSAVAADSLTALLPTSCVPNIVTTVTPAENLAAPVAAGVEVGTVTYTCDSGVIGTLSLLASADTPSAADVRKQQSLDLLRLTWWLLPLLLLVLALVIVRRRQRKKQRQRRRRRITK